MLAMREPNDLRNIHVVSLAFLVWYFFPVEIAVGNYAVAIIQVSPNGVVDIPPTLNNSLSSSEEARNRHARLITSEFVLNSVLNKKDISGLTCVASHEPKAMQWLQQAIVVEIPKDSGLLVITIRDSADTTQLTKILNQLISTFKKEVIVANEIREATVTDKLDKFLENSVSSYRKKLGEYLMLKHELDADADNNPDAYLIMMKESLKSDLDFINEITRELKLRKLKSEFRDDVFRVLQRATGVVE